MQDGQYGFIQTSNKILSVLLLGLNAWWVGW